MGSKIQRWRATTGLASLILGVFLTAVVLLFAVGLNTYQQIVATRQVVSATATAALRTAAPAGFAGESVATAASTVADNLSVSTSAYVKAVQTALPTFWAGSSVTPCTTTPAGSPVACTSGTSFLVTLPASTAAALNISGPLVVSHIQFADTPPYTITHFGQSTTLSEPAVAADVAVPLHLVIGSLITLNPWVTIGITNVLYADQGGPTGGSARFLPYGTATAAPTEPSFCWSWPDSSDPACASQPDYCDGDATACSLNPGGSSGDFGSSTSGGSVSNVVNSTETETSLGTILSASDPPSLPWIMPASGLCWVEVSSTEYTLTGTAGSPDCATLPSTDAPYPWTTEIVNVAATFDTQAQSCYIGSLPGAPSGSATSTPVWVCEPPASSGGGGGTFSCPSGEYICGTDTCCVDPVPI